MKVNFDVPAKREAKPRPPRMLFDTLNRPYTVKRGASKQSLNFHLGSFKATVCGELADYLPGVYGPNVLGLSDWQQIHPENKCQQCKFLLDKSNGRQVNL